VHYGYVPGFGFYCFGLIHLVGAFAKSGTSLIRQLVDAGTLSNLPGGFKTKGARIKGDDTPIAPGEFRDMDVPSGVLKDNLMPLPYKEPSQVLYSLLNTIVEEGRRFASVADMKISDMSAQAPVGTTLAILERTLKVMSAVQARVHYSFKQELCLLRDIIRDYTPDEYDYEPVDAGRKAKKSDYDHVDIIPVSDPNAATMAQKIVQYQAVLQLAQGAPQIYDLPQLHRQMLEVLGIKNAQKLVPLDDDKKPRDPISENMDVLNGKPVKAFIYQDQDAHITSHQAFLNDPQTAAIIGQNPMANQITAGMQAHIAEHFGFKYRLMIEQQLGAPLPKPNEDMPEEYEIQISRLVAQASQQVLAANQAQAAQQQAQEQMQDPIIQMQMQELEIKGQEVQRKAQKDQVDAQLKAAQIEIEKDRIEAQIQLEGTKLGAKIANDKAELAAKMTQSQDEIDAREHMEGTRIGVDIAKSKEKAALEMLKIAAAASKKPTKGN
jgi:hypothetical protein